MFVRRYYYDLASGETVLSYMRQGDVLAGSMMQDYSAQEQLAGRSEADTGCMEWLTPDAEIEAQFAAHNGVKAEIGALVFYDIPVPEKDPTYDALLEAYTILTGGETNA
jgi:hypothetical protein